MSKLPDQTSASSQGRPPGPSAWDPRQPSGPTLPQTSGFGGVDMEVILPETRPLKMSAEDEDTEDDCVVYEQSDLANLAFPVMADLRREGQLCDVTIRLADCEDWAFKGHKLVLAATFPYFHAMFTHGMIESREETVTIGHCDVEAGSLESLLNFSYSGKLVINGMNVRSLMVSANFLQASKVDGVIKSRTSL